MNEEKLALVESINQSITELRQNKSVVEKQIEMGEAVRRLDDNPDFVKLFDDLKTKTMQYTLNLSDANLTGFASQNLLGISRFLTTIQTYHTEYHTAKEQLEYIEQQLLINQDELADVLSKD